MELALITAQQVAVLFLLIGTGMVAVKTGVLKLENKQALSNLLVYIVVPAMVVNSYRMEFSAQILRNLLAASQSAQSEALKAYMSGQFAYYNPRPVPSFAVPAPYQFAGCNGSQYVCGACA